MTILVCLVLNFLLYLFASNRYGRKGKMSLTYTLSVYYAFVAFMGIIICSTGIYEAVLPINYKYVDCSYNTYPSAMITKMNATTAEVTLYIS